MQDRRDLFCAPQSREGEATESYFLCSKRAIPSLLEKAEREKQQILLELRLYYNCNIDIEIVVAQHFRGFTIGGRLIVNGKKVREYELLDLLFYDLNALIMSAIVKQREAYDI